MTDKEAVLFIEEIRKRIKNTNSNLYIKTSSLLELKQLYSLCKRVFGATYSTLYEDYGKNCIISINIYSEGAIMIDYCSCKYAIFCLKKEVTTFSSIYNKVKNMKGVD